MRVLGGAAIAVLLALVAPAHAGGFGLPNGPCLLFCDAKPAAHAADAKPIAAPRDLHPTHAAADAEPKRASRPTPAKPSHFIHRPQPVIASAPRPIPTPPRPSPIAVAAPSIASTAVAVPATLAAKSVANASELSPASASAAPSEEANLPAVAPSPSSVEHGSDPAIHLLAQAFSESPQQAPTPVASPTPKAEAVAAPPPVTVAMVEPAEPSAFVRVTANGLVFPWWPDSFPSRAAVWIVAVALIAATAFGLVIASGRRLAA